MQRHRLWGASIQALRQAAAGLGEATGPAAGALPQRALTAASASAAASTLLPALGAAQLPACFRTFASGPIASPDHFMRLNSLAVVPNSTQDVSAAAQPLMPSQRCGIMACTMQCAAKQYCT